MKRTYLRMVSWLSVAIVCYCLTLVVGVESHLDRVKRDIDCHREAVKRTVAGPPFTKARRYVYDTHLSRCRRTLHRERRSSSLMYPGTKWCGPGNNAKDFNDLGTERETDKCCRTHDHCKDFIAGSSSANNKYKLANTSPYTASSCKCDAILYRCLKMANTEASNGVGNLFFNVFQIQCFKGDGKGGYTFSSTASYR
ncbi:phospholipase A2-like [Lineus longissimus]|uniref:phospholipase A2-like n=1 Tax=Lineus longissimus TaxID=88925 RepID=UPI002B4D3C53